MQYDKDEFSEYMKKWKTVLSSYKMPEWNNLPSIELYMDQVIALINQYICVFTDISDSDKGITAPMINNYVKLRAMPAPVKKRYSKIHLAYLIMICSLKQSLSIPTITKIIPLLENEDETAAMYGCFIKNQQKAFSYVTEKVSEVAEPIIAVSNDNPDRIHDLVIQIAISANLCKTLSENVSDMTKKLAENEQ